MSDTSTDWAEQAVALRRDHAMATAEIAERFGKSASQVRRVLSAANTDRAVNGREEGAIPGQTTVDDQLAEGNPLEVAPADEYDVDPADDPEHPDTMAEFRANAGEPVGEMPKREMDTGDVVVETRLAGTRQMALDFGENADIPVGGTLVIRSDKLASGFYGLGDIITGTFTARVVDVAGKERLQRASEEFRAQPQQHVALITELQVRT